MLIIKHLQRGGGYVIPNICYVEENESLVFKPEIKEKVVNNIRIAPISEGSGFSFCEIKSSDGSDKPAYFEYPVTSDVFLNTDKSGPIPYCSIGEVAPNDYKLVLKGTKILSCSPEEDDTYIYKVIIE